MNNEHHEHYPEKFRVPLGIMEKAFMDVIDTTRAAWVRPHTDDGDTELEVLRD